MSFVMFKAIPIQIMNPVEIFLKNKTDYARILFEASAFSISATQYQFHINNLNYVEHFKLEAGPFSTSILNTDDFETS